MLSQMKDDIMGIARNYGKYIINRGSLSSLTKRMVGYANEYMSDIPAVWAYLYGKHIHMNLIMRIFPISESIQITASHVMFTMIYM